MAEALPAEGIVAVHDADVLVDLTDAVARIEAGPERWAIPHTYVHRLTADSTTLVLAGTKPEGLPVEQRPYVGFAGGGAVVLRVEDYRQVPLDPRFAGWGREDEAWAMALTTMLGDPWRGLADLWHLWHPHPERENRLYGNRANNDLWRRYRRAARSKPAMEALLAEFR